LIIGNQFTFDSAGQSKQIKYVKKRIESRRIALRHCRRIKKKPASFGKRAFLIFFLMKLNTRLRLYVGNDYKYYTNQP